MTQAASGETMRWAIRLMPRELLASGNLRLRSSIEARVDDAGDLLWLRGTGLPTELERELHKLALDGIFNVAADGFLRRRGPRLPQGRLSEQGWVPLDRWLRPEAQPAAPLAQKPGRVPIRLQRSAEERPATVLLTNISTWAAFARTAPLVRLSVLRMAASADGRVVIRGTPLPSMNGERYAEASGIAVQCGWEIRPAADPPLIARLLHLSEGDLALFRVDASYERIAAVCFTRCTRRDTANPHGAALMSNLQDEAAAYLSPAVDSFWRWTGNGEGVEWADGTTIAFRPEIESLIERLAPLGLPRFGAVVLLLAACRDNWAASSGRRAVEKLAGGFRPTAADSSVGQAVFSFIAHSVQSTLQQLDAVSKLPADLRHGRLAKAALAETVFEPGKKQLTAERSAVVLSELAAGVNPTALLLSAEPLSEFAADCDALQPGLAQVNAESLRLRSKTGLDEPVSPAELDLPACERTSQLLAELLNDREFAGLARVAQQLMAAVHVPRSLQARDELPVGGVSDLANRGSPDRLLISELANDSLTLAVRIALNEALYLRRESPPRDPPHRRAILLDCGIRLWGVPRVFAVAAAMAFAATTDPTARVSAFAAAGECVEPLDLTTRAGLVSCMGMLEARPHPGEALAPFLSAITDDGASPADPILITHPDVLADADFAPALAKAASGLLYVATVNEAGDFRMFAISPAGRKRLTEAQIDLKTLFSGRKTTATPLVVHPSLPTIWSVEPFPLRLPSALKPARAVGSAKLGLVGVTKDGRLMHWDQPGPLARQLCTQIPARRVIGVFHVESMRSIVVVVKPKQNDGARMLRYELETGEVEDVLLPLQTKEPSGCCIAGPALCVISGEREISVEAFSLADGAPLAKLSQKVWSLRRLGRFFNFSEYWHALACDGQQLLFEKLSPVRRVILYFDTDSGNGRLELHFDGSVKDSTGASISLKPDSPNNVWPMGASADGTRIVVSTGSRYYGLDLTAHSPEWQVLSRAPEEFLVPQFHQSLLQPGMAPIAWSGIFIDNQTRLVLVSARGQHWAMDIASGKCCLLLIGTSPQRPRYQAFQPIDLPEDIGIKFEMVKWEDGSRAVIDSRRLLHLRSSDVALPELTLVLNQDSAGLSAWCSDGRVFGNKAWFLDREPAPQEQLAELVRQFVLRLR